MKAKKNVIALLNNRNFYFDWNKHTSKQRFRYFKNKEIKRIIGENTVAALIEIILEFKPKIWIIENPASSKIFNWIETYHCLIGIKNKTYYSSYNSEFSMKPTIFYSNLKLNLKTNRVQGKKRIIQSCTYDIRSKIPMELINDIFKNIEI